VEAGQQDNPTCASSQVSPFIYTATIQKIHYKKNKIFDTAEAVSRCSIGDVLT
jgi:hypothetical protein